MPIAGDVIPFTEANVDSSPAQSGVYALFDGKAVVYYGCSDTSIRGRLQCHLRGDEGPCTRGASHYKREVTSKPKAREKELLDAFKAANGRLPRCNEKGA
jgi:hypothetical protein